MAQDNKHSQLVYSHLITGFLLGDVQHVYLAESDRETDTLTCCYYKRPTLVVTAQQRAPLKH